MPEYRPRTFRETDERWAAANKEAARRGESISAAIRRYLDKQYTKGKG